ncbi:hypothetical protein M407DRAFT_208956 [Tulasnella calospora MUT 4182]|uniref:DUF6699 domain-containing protein n=1 Tax=Tulasnella calospora MUT 4182 TaxID=1051891 RepID=A0A0C3QI59_9AGAM|nr:hypothetical protein M407DRAFT_208956 [Tulasnella calospora MUT 4182]
MDKFTAGPNYGPVLTTTDLYLLGCELDLHPILTHAFGGFHLILNLASGHAGGYNPANKDQDLELAHGNEPATIPRVQELHIVCRLAPWHTHIKNPTGVTVADFCTAVGKQYSESFITDAELDTLPPRTRDQVRRAAQNAQQIYGAPGWGGGYYGSPSPGGNGQRLSRSAWLRDRIFFDGLEKDDDFAVKQLGFKASNIFCMQVTS